jgi:hypothetical protein
MRLDVCGRFKVAGHDPAQVPVVEEARQQFLDTVEDPVVR